MVLDLHNNPNFIPDAFVNESKRLQAKSRHNTGAKCRPPVNYTGTVMCEPTPELHQRCFEVYALHVPNSTWITPVLHGTLHALHLLKAKK
jgi:hypothetical protein